MASSHVAPKISSARWKYLKALKLGPGRLIHTSAAVAMIPHPTNPMLPSTPWIERPGHTFNIGSNLRKRTRKLSRAIGRCVSQASA